MFDKFKLKRSKVDIAEMKRKRRLAEKALEQLSSEALQEIAGAALKERLSVR